MPALYARLMQESEPTEPRRRGRRTADRADTREQIVAAARAEFVANGYAATSVRGIARRAGVDPALVRYWFEGGKPELLSASLMHPLINPARMVDVVLAGPPEGIGVRLVTLILTAWHVPGGQERLRLVLTAAVSGEDGGAVRDFLSTEVFERVARLIPGPDPELRATLVASQVVGLLIARDVVRVEPLASAPVAQVAAWVGRSVQLYIDGDLPPAHVGTPLLPPEFLGALRPGSIAPPDAAISGP